MRWTMSNKPCEALRIRRIRRQCRRRPRRFAYLWSGKVKPRLFEVESMFESSKVSTISKRQYGMELEGNPKWLKIWMKRQMTVMPNTSGYLGFKSSASNEGATSEKMISQIHKASHPELGCSGNLNLTVTVQPVNVGTTHLGRKTGLAATDVGCVGREIRSSLSQIRSGTWRRDRACCYSKGSRQWNVSGAGTQPHVTKVVCAAMMFIPGRKLCMVTYHVIALLCTMSSSKEGAVCAERCKHGFEVREIGNTLGIVTSHCE